MNIKERYYLTIRFIRKLNFFLKEKFTEYIDASLYSLGINDNSLSFEKKLTDRKRIIFVGLTPSYRVIKNLKWLKRLSTFELIILHHASTEMKDLLPEYYNKKKVFRNKIHLKRIFKAMKNVDLIYGYTSKPSYPRIALEMSDVPTIFDPYDTYVVYYGKNPSQKWLSMELADEEYCFKNSTAVLARNTEAYLAFKMYNLSKTPNIFFSDYCDNDYFVDNRKKLQSDEITIAYSGGIYGKHVQKSAHGFDNFSELIESVEVQKIHFHIYPSPSNYKEVYYDFIETAQKVNFLHVHQTVKQNELSTELSKYHFGVLPHFKDADSKILDEKLARGTSNKFYNFLEAGIPILVSSEMKFMAWVVDRYKIGIVFSRKDISNLRNIILSHNYEELKNNVLKVREKLSMAVNTKRLISFINKIADMKK